MVKLDLLYKQPFSFYFIEISTPSSSRLLRLHAYLILSNVPTTFPTAYQDPPFIRDPKVTFSNCKWVVLIYNTRYNNSYINYPNMLTLCMGKLCIWKTILCGTSDLVVAPSNTHFSKTSHGIQRCFLDRLGWSKKTALFCFSSQSYVLQFFPYFSGRIDSRPGRFF